MITDITEENEDEEEEEMLEVDEVEEEVDQFGPALVLDQSELEEPDRITPGDVYGGSFTPISPLPPVKEVTTSLKSSPSPSGSGHAGVTPLTEAALTRMIQEQKEAKAGDDHET